MTIRCGLLSDLFVGVVAKRLTLVETVTKSSNQHEFQGTRPLRKLFGEEDQRNIQTRFVWLAGEQEGVSEDGFLSWSNVRKGKPRTAEYHLYYSGNAVTEAMRPGDTMFLARRLDGSILVVVVPAGSTVDSQMMWLFGIEEQRELKEEYKDIEHDRQAELDFAARYVLDELGIEIEEPEVDVLDDLLVPFGMSFPTTAVFSAIARKSLPHVDPRDGADLALMAWLEREESLFKRLERTIVAQRLKTGFMGADEADVEGFLSFSLSVQNRRKSRAGQSLENHLETVFKAHGLRYARGTMTEGKSKPDFLFPGDAEYQDAAFPPEKLTLLGSKSTCKDRWRQVLSEGVRVHDKHLVTLEPSISENQTDEMKTHRLQLVLPKAIHATYKPAQQAWLMDLTGFIGLVQDRQEA
ncbi:type II restriction endonuclease [Methylocella tundrae]|uniref:Restriction endonuclease n=1 Tax=Methylocella tundrae TaxID=227605 RepID=A0A4U8Z0S4_METTU|nr:type II restriction endonuclease [Methylocella tundrae]WPP06212.1 type II restriction endonuclease [Methylocella tundrae]VFU08872.1 Restriction endonuclease [Methylocella tundrae]